MKFLNHLKAAAAVVAFAVALLMPPVASASVAPEQRIARGERFPVTVPVNISQTIAGLAKYAVASPTRGYINALLYAYEGPNPTTSGSAQIVARISNTVVNLVSLTIPASTTALTGISSSTPLRTSNTYVLRGQVIELFISGTAVVSGTNGGPGRVTIDITPDYTPTRFKQ